MRKAKVLEVRSVQKLDWNSRAYTYNSLLVKVDAEYADWRKRGYKVVLTNPTFLVIE